MNITKFGHCCMLIEEKGVRIVTDPGSFTAQEQEALTDIHVILVTHEHGDHFHIPSVREMLKKNPSARIVCNPSVGAILAQENIAYEVIGDRETSDASGLSIEGFGTTHALIHPLLPQSQNTGFFIAEKLWYPGDAFPEIDRPIEVLALPVAGPWMKSSEAIDYALKLKPQRAFPVHDGILNPALIASGAFDRWFRSILEPRSTSFLTIELGREYQVA